VTWLKLPTEFAVDCAGLSDAAFRQHVEGLLAVMARETGGPLTDREVERLSEGEHVANACLELVAHGFWQRTRSGYVVVQGMENQPEPDLIRRRREASQARVNKYRRGRAGLPSVAPGNAVTTRVTRDLVLDRDQDLEDPTPLVREQQGAVDPWSISDTARAAR
jgi:hypothetical protein